MADPALRLATNVPGPFFVDSTCIDCGTCMWMAPTVFEERGAQSAVHAQPDDEARQRALQALVACPTASIGTDPPDPGVAAAAASFPVPVVDGVWHMGYHDEASFGAASWLVRTGAGLVMVDVPRFAGPLVRRVGEMGGLAAIVLTHKDDVASHGRWAERFAAPRTLHADDVGRATRDVEHQPQGTDAFEVAGLAGLPVPGHTRGHVVYRHEDVLFSGDHLAWSPERERLVAFRRACWYSWPEQTKSMARLLEDCRRHETRWILPGHGDPVRLEPDETVAHLERLVAWMESA